MRIQVNTDGNIEGRQDLVAQVEATVSKSLSDMSAHITRVDVHLSDDNGGKHGQHDKRCLMEARVEGRHSSAVTCAGATVTQAVSGAADKLKHSLQSTMDRIREHR